MYNLVAERNFGLRTWEFHWITLGHWDWILIPLLEGDFVPRYIQQCLFRCTDSASRRPRSIWDTWTMKSPSSLHQFINKDVADSNGWSYEDVFFRWADPRPTSKSVVRRGLSGGYLSVQCRLLVGDAFMPPYHRRRNNSPGFFTGNGAGSHSQLSALYTQAMCPCHLPSM